MNYLYGWNSVAEFILDEFTENGLPVDGVVVDDVYIHDLVCTAKVRVIPASALSLTSADKVINCLGYRDLARRISIGERLRASGVLERFVSATAKVHRTSSVADGSIVLGDVVIERESKVGMHCLLWGGSRVCHNSQLGEGVFLASGAIVGGACHVGNLCSLGFNSSMREKSCMPDGTKLGANRFWRPPA